MNQIVDYKVIFIGAGNLATQLSIALQKTGCEILQVYSKTETSAALLAGKLQVPYSTSLAEISPEADVYIFSVKDYAIANCANKLNLKNKLFVHTAGSVPLSVFDEFTNRSGVIYPLQTFSKERTVSFKEIPFFIETKNEKDEQILLNLSNLLSDKIHVLSSEKRKYLHLSAVFACNFTNHMYDLASRILENQDLPFEYLLPLIKETAEKVETIHPHNAQTGPAVRFDKTVIDNHLKLIPEEKNRDLYEKISQSIRDCFS